MEHGESGIWRWVAGDNQEWSKYGHVDSDQQYRQSQWARDVVEQKCQQCGGARPQAKANRDVLGARLVVPVSQQAGPRQAGQKP